jgi:hypothetical protein
LDKILLVRHLLNEGRSGIDIQGGGATRRGQGKQGGGQRNIVARNADKFAIQKCVEEYVFPKQKFVTDGDLDFSNNEMSICQCMAVVLNVDNQTLRTGGRLQGSQYKSQYIGTGTTQQR